MARHAGALAPVDDVDVGVTPDARIAGLRRRVRRMAARANRVGGSDRRGDREAHRKRGLGAVAPDARVLAAGDERMRLMTEGARVVVGGTRTGWLLVARRAHLEGDRGRSVNVMAVETPLRARVLSMRDRTLVVAAGAIGHGDRRRIVYAMASGAIGRGVLHDRRRFPMALPMAIDASGFGSIGGEGMA